MWHPTNRISLPTLEGTLQPPKLLISRGLLYQDRGNMNYPEAPLSTLRQYADETRANKLVAVEELKLSYRIMGIW